MAEVTNELIYETLKRMQDRDARTDRKVDDILRELRSVKEHQAAFMHSEVAQDSRIAEIYARVDRIERRLELRDAD